ncbi:SRPBCC domain-containing protein [Steroidobacter sp. S1-65]|uniref:SRPBCC domain-containing protein n=1 Tax=Steroidobacter gossypii TaxID=2805490 RepID=A0ABS1WYL5_9GAMM|nr:SRPBCC domain-containing protein [Steroidobacter gossypii]
MHEFDLAGERRNARIDAASRIIAATPAALYRAHMDPQALISWLPPEGMKGRIEQFEPRVGGTYRMVLTYEQSGQGALGKTTDRSDVVAGRFVELAQDRRIVQVVEFESDDPAFAGEMRITWTFTPVATGTHVMVRCEHAPPGIRAEDHQAGLASSLGNLARYCE